MVAVKDPEEICGIQSRQFPNESAGLCLVFVLVLVFFQELNSVVAKVRHKIFVVKKKTKQKKNN